MCCFLPRYTSPPRYRLDGLRSSRGCHLDGHHDHRLSGRRTHQQLLVTVRTWWQARPAACDSPLPALHGRAATLAAGTACPSNRPPTQPWWLGPPLAKIIRCDAGGGAGGQCSDRRIRVLFAAPVPPHARESVTRPTIGVGHPPMPAVPVPNCAHLCPWKTRLCNSDCDPQTTTRRTPQPRSTAGCRWCNTELASSVTRWWRRKPIQAGALKITKCSRPDTWVRSLGLRPMMPVDVPLAILESCTRV
mmetsp:Transcript_4049/g.13354  ORF Transcript_4049/g.13354 Transcript_4049/m.13354 type:complete len:247 (-) Transcript_4049:146-886(-)